MVQAVSVALNVLLLLAIGASAAAWIKLVRDRWGLGPRSFVESILPSRPRARPFWTLADVLVMLGSMFLVSQLLMLWMVSQGWIERPPRGESLDLSTPSATLASIAASSLGGLAGIAVVLSWLCLFDRDPRRGLGLTFSLEEVGLGLKASVMILPPVMLVSAAVAYYLRKYEHPVLDSLAAFSTPEVFVATFIGTAIVTPLVEEFLVRVLLQGALQGLADRHVDEEGLWRPHAFWPVVVASVVFSVLHIGQGAAPIPLLILSLGLGFLYRQTGSILPPMIVHMVLNSLTLIVQFLELSS